MARYGVEKHPSGEWCVRDLRERRTLRPCYGAGYPAHRAAADRLALRLNAAETEKEARDGRGIGAG